MTPADGIRKLGFRRWYERQLIESHLYLITGFMSMVVVLACLEDLSPRGPGWKPLLTLAVVLASGVVCMVALHRYQRMLARAEQLAEQSTCGECGVYGVLKVMSSKAAPDPKEGDAELEVVSVQCRKCGHQWTMGPG